MIDVVHGKGFCCRNGDCSVRTGCRRGFTKAKRLQTLSQDFPNRPPVDEIAAKEALPRPGFPPSRTISASRGEEHAANMADEIDYP